MLKLISITDGEEVRFVDETPDIESHYVSGPNTPLHGDYEEPDQSSEGTIEVIDAESLEVIPDRINNSIHDSPLPASKSYDALPRTEAYRQYGPIPHNSLLGLASVESVSIPLTRPHEVRLMKYYLEYMCTWVSFFQLVQSTNIRLSALV
jgi:hypothetical protein